MSKKAKSDQPEHFDCVSFSIVQLPLDQANFACQRVLQVVTKSGVTKKYVTESAYFRGELYKNLSTFIEQSYESSIRKAQPALSPVKGGRHWVRFSEDMLSKDFKATELKRLSPEDFE